MDTGHSQHRLLLVDGDPKSLRVLGVSLRKAGFAVVTATSGRAALAALQAEPPSLIISDTDLAEADEADEIDGFELCRQVKGNPEWAKIPFLFVSGRKSIEDKIRGLELGGDDYLTKPVYIKEIALRVRTALQRVQREPLESRRDTRTKFAGDLSDIGVVDLVQTIDVNRKSGIVHIVNRDGRRGAIFFRDGNVIDAEVGRLTGVDAIYRLFSWSEGRFEVEFKPIRRKDVVDLPSAGLLIEGMRRLDEWTRLLESLPPLDVIPEVDVPVLAERLGDLPDEMNGILRLCDGNRSLLAVVDDSEIADLEALILISRLFAEKILLARHSERGNAAAEDLASEAWLTETDSHGETTSPATARSTPAKTDTLLGFPSDDNPPLAEAPWPFARDTVVPVELGAGVPNDVPPPEERITHEYSSRQPRFAGPTVAGTASDEGNPTAPVISPNESQNEPSESVLAPKPEEASEYTRSSEADESAPVPVPVDYEQADSERAAREKSDSAGPNDAATAVFASGAPVLFRRLALGGLVIGLVAVAALSPRWMGSHTSPAPTVSGPDAQSLPVLPVFAQAAKSEDAGAFVPDAKSPETPNLRDECLRVDDRGKGRPKAVLAACRPAVKANPRSSDLLLIMARAELERGKAADARDWANRAIQLDPALADAYVYLGTAEQVLGNKGEAKAAYRKYLQIVPTGRRARELRAVLDNL